MPDEDKRGGNSLFANSFTPSQAYCDFLMNLENNCNDELYFHLQKADRSKCPRCRELNSSYVKYC